MRAAIARVVGVLREGVSPEGPRLLWLAGALAAFLTAYASSCAFLLMEPLP